ncbi:response regulator [Oscillatoriales cyanobacterium LEGE 11467]|uniref:histidine kinase n=1 Tax=Zarconia navalis LEGE 11467 TaxID=1828826 RepID=A0A928Z7U5_9CYAN|nr:response regulator [Zarconia navalis]MBE9040058.1 response regulator [Zarconia navalis LEGE 11467]
MLPEQQRILGYFIEEAGDHLNTIEQGLLNLQATIEDTEMLNEVFRAAHSVKGGAAMLGLSSIQQISHRLEDGFKILKETPVRVDRELESLLLRIFDALQELLDRLQSPGGLTDAAAEQTMAGVEPVFGQLNRHLELLVDGQVEETDDRSGLQPITNLPITTKPSFGSFDRDDDEESAAIQLIFQSDVLARLREMLQLFKQPDSPQTREQLVQICRLLARAGEQFDLVPWDRLLKAVEQAIANPNNTFSTLASISIKEIKQAQELVLANRSDEIAIGQTLEELLPTVGEPELEPDLDVEDLLDIPSEHADNVSEPELNFEIEPELDFGDLLDIPSEHTDNASEPELDFGDLLEIPPDPAESEPESELWEELNNSSDDRVSLLDIDPPVSSTTSKSHHPRGPAVGQEELNTLADLFEDEAPELEVWEDVPDIISGFELSPPSDDRDSDISDSDFAEFLLDDGDLQPSQPSRSSLEDDFDLFGYDFDGEDAGSALEEFETPDSKLEQPSTPPESESLVDLLENLEDDGEADLFSAQPPSSAGDRPTDDEQPSDSASEWDGLWDEEELTTSSSPIQEAKSSEDKMNVDEFDNFFNFDSSDPTPSSSQTHDDLSFDDLFSADEPPEVSHSPTTELEDLSTDWFDEETQSEPSNSDDEDPLDFFDGFDLDVSDADDLQDLSAEGQALEELFSDTESDSPSEPFTLATDAQSVSDRSEFFGRELPAKPNPDTTDETLDFDFESDDPSSDSSFESFDDLLGEVSEDLDVSELFDSDLSVELAQEESLDFDGLLEEEAGEDPALGEPEEPETPAELVPLELLLSLEPELSGPSVFSNLEAYLDRPSAAPATFTKSPAPSAPVAQKTESKSDFDDLEKLLEETDKTGGMTGPTKARGGGEARGRTRRRGSGFEQTMRVPIKQLDNLSNLVGELVVSRNSLEQDQERLRQFLDSLLHQVQQLSDVGQRMQDLYERTLLEMALLASRQNRVKAAQNINASHNDSQGDAGEFEALEMDRFTDFHTQAQEIIELIVRVRESASDIEFLVAENDQITRQLRQTTSQLQEGLTRSRMVPFSQTADRLPRGVRDNAIKFGKQVELQIEGRYTLIDKMILEHLHDPLTHLVNNAIAHGIEPPDTRSISSKTPTGRITVSAFHQGNQTIISVADDGAGIDAQTVKQKALQKALITPEQAEKMTDLDVYDLLFLPGFSTRDKADDLAGRGVGMDVVNTKLTEIRGTVNTDSTLGRGTTFTIRLPLTLSISKALCCISDRASIAFPMDGVAEVLDTFPQSRLSEDEKGQRCVPWRDQMVPFQPLQELFNYNRHIGRSRYSGTTSTDDDTIAVVIVRSGTTYLAVEVDQVMGEQEIVIKQLEGPVPKPMGIAGATVMGDGRIVPIADVLELIDLSMGRVRREANVSLWDNGAAPVKPVREKTEPTVLIIDDSITVRELLSMTFKKAGYRVEQARDGQEAWDKLRSGIPCELVFCDMEMPRMNGMELLSRMNKDSHLSQLPIAMLTSRTAEKHKQMAIELGARGYFTKPYLEEVLLDAAQRMLKGEVLVTLKSKT